MWSNSSSVIWYPEIINELPPYEFEIIDGVWWYAVFCKYYMASVALTALYLISVLGIKKFMEKRAPLALTQVYFTWNVLTVLFSIVSLSRIIPDFIFATKEHNGFIQGLCTR